jgi:hypothetical protein
LIAHHDLTGAVVEMHQDSQRLLWKTGRPALARDLSRDTIHQPTIELQVRFSSHASR